MLLFPEATGQGARTDGDARCVGAGEGEAPLLLLDRIGVRDIDHLV